MAARTYLVGLRLALKAIDRYSKRWQVQLQANMTTGQYTCLLAVMEAVTECLVTLGSEAINP